MNDTRSVVKHNVVKQVVNTRTELEGVYCVCLLKCASGTVHVLVRCADNYSNLYLSVKYLPSF